MMPECCALHKHSQARNLTLPGGKSYPEEAAVTQLGAGATCRELGAGLGWVSREKQPTATDEAVVKPVA